MGKGKGPNFRRNHPQSEILPKDLRLLYLYAICLMYKICLCSDLGAVVGLLKVGSKKLFIYDHNGAQHELDPMCVLDFYVHESRQRLGYGKKLFEYMLKVKSRGGHGQLKFVLHCSSQGWLLMPSTHSPIFFIVKQLD